MPISNTGVAANIQLRGHARSKAQSALLISTAERNPRAYLHFVSDGLQNDRRIARRNERYPRSVRRCSRKRSDIATEDHVVLDDNAGSELIDIQLTQVASRPLMRRRVAARRVPSPESTTIPICATLEMRLESIRIWPWSRKWFGVTHFVEPLSFNSRQRIGRTFGGRRSS